MRIPTPFIANPGASATLVLFDSRLEGAAGEGLKPQPTRKARFRAWVYTNVADAVLKVETYGRFGSTPRSVSSETIDADTFWERDVLLMPGRTVVSLVTITAPTTFEAEAEVIDDQALAQ